ncbi:MAG TPA: heparinase II/III family protein [Bryobacteraceae bacterium]
MRETRMRSFPWPVLLLLPQLMAASRPLTTPYHWTENFQGPNLGQFASYPPVQDVGYDPSLSPTTDFEAPGGRSLMRVIKPPRTGPARFGFVRRLPFLASTGARLRFSYRLDYARPEDRFEIGFAGTDGHRYTAWAPIEAGARWHTAELPLSAFKDAAGREIAGGAGIDGLYLLADLKRADADITYRFLIDDLEVRAEREVEFEIVAPRAARVAHWRTLFAADMVDAGQAVAVEAKPPVPLARAECEVKDQDGRTVRTEPLRYSRGLWSNPSVAVAPANAPGVYTLLLRGSTADGNVVSTSVRVICRAPGRTAHPRLYFGPADRQMLLARTRDPRYAGLWRRLEEQARSSRDTGDLGGASAIFAMLDPVNLLPTLPGYFSIVTKAGQSVQYNALHSWIAGDAESRAAAKSALLAVARWSAWAPPWFAAHDQHTYYPAGQLAGQAALAYDLLYADLSPAEREIVRRGIFEHGIQPPYEEYVADNRILANTSNWIGHTVGGGLLAAAAISGDGAPPNLDLYVNGLLAKLEDHLAASYLSDGSYGEGISYQEFDMETDALVLPALERVFGIDYWSRSHVKDSLWYAISTLAKPVSGSLDMGDTHNPAGRTIAPVVARSQNPVFRWFADHFPLASMHDLLFPYEALKAEPPPSPGSRYFHDKGMVVFRTGWSEDDVMLLYRAGPNFNHNHADEGSFLLRALGENLVTEAGYSDYYKDPYYDSYFKQAAGHNTVLVNGDPASQEVADTLAFPALDEYPRITNVLLSPSLDAVSSELRQVYRGTLRRFDRRLVFVKPDYLIVSDDLATGGPPANFDWLLHLPDRRRLRTTAEGAIYQGEKASLAIRALSPERVRYQSDEGHLPFSVFNPSAPAAVPGDPAVLHIGTEGASLRYVVVLAPARTTAEAQARSAGLHRTRGAGCDAVEIGGGLLLLRDSIVGEASYDGLSTDAAMLYVRSEGGQEHFLAVQSATKVVRGRETLLTSDKPVSVAAEFNPDGIRLSVASDSAGTIRLRKPNGRIAEVAVQSGRREVVVPLEDR